MVLYDPDFAANGGKEAYHTLTAVDGRRGDKEGWAFWYIGTPVVHPTRGTLFAFTGAGGGFGELPAALPPWPCGGEGKSPWAAAPVRKPL